MASLAYDVAVLVVLAAMVWRGAFLKPSVVPLVRLNRELRAEFGEGSARAPEWVAGAVRRLEGFRDLRRMLIVAGLRDTPVEWVMRGVGLMLVVLAVTAIVDGALYPSLHDLLVPIWACLALAASMLPLRAWQLARRVRTRRAEAGYTLGSMFKLFQILGRRPMRHHAALDPGDPIVVFARCRRHKVLLEMLTDPRWHSLVTRPTTTWEWFDGFGDAYGIEEAHQHATVVRNASEGSEAAQADEYGRAARSWTSKWRGGMRSLFTSQGLRRVVWRTLLLLPMLIVIFSSIIGGWVTS